MTVGIKTCIEKCAKNIFHNSPLTISVPILSVRLNVHMVGTIINSKIHMKTL